MSSPLLAPSNRYPVTDTAQVFQGDDASGVLRFLDDALTDPMVGVLLETSLLAGDLLELSLCRLRLFALKVAAAVGIDPALGLHGFPAVHDAVTVRSNVDNPQVHTQRVRCRTGFGGLHRAGCVQVKGAATHAQIALPPLSGQQFPLTLPAHKGDALPPGDGPHGDLRRVQLPGQDTVIVWDGAVRSKNTHRVVIFLVRISHFANAAHHDLSRQVKRIAHGLVRQAVKWELTKRAGVPGRSADGVAGIVGLFQRLQKGLGLVVIREKFDLCCQDHTSIIKQMFYYFNLLKPKGGALSSPCLKAGMSSANFG